MDIVQKVNSWINIPSSQTFKSYIYKNLRVQIEGTHLQMVGINFQTSPSLSTTETLTLCKISARLQSPSLRSPPRDEPKCIKTNEHGGF
jgi:hypothetical protein